MTITLKLKKQPEVYLEAECITPDVFAQKSVDKIKNLTVYLGNREKKLGEFFDIAGESGKTADETNILVEGDCSSVFRIGQKMSAGEITVKGNCGMHVANRMSGGKVTVEGSAGAWAGAMMDDPNDKGGELLIMGDAGNHCASAYIGYWVGVNCGKITVKGRVGVESGSWMRATRSRNKWPVLRCGSADYYLGVHNHGGTIICEGNAEGRVGADMARGQIVINGKVKKMLSSFKKLGEIKEIKSPAGPIKGNYVEYQGDFAVSKKPPARLYVKK
ncbi:MAG: formylmethanofuran dehydrogenase subunit C [Promethearchaeota archaeon]